MNKNIIIVIILAVVLVFVYLVWQFAFPKEALNNQENILEQKPVFDPKNAIYTIDGKEIKLVDGKAEEELTPGSASKLITTVFGEPAIGDLNSDKVMDAALIIVQDSGGSGIFYYAVLAINDNGNAIGSNAILLGDRIAPQNISIVDGQIIVNYAERKPGEPMSTQPSVGVTKKFMASGTTLLEYTGK